MSASVFFDYKTPSSLVLMRFGFSGETRQIARWALIGLALLAFGFLLFYGSDALASGGMPWEDPICKVSNSIKGPVAKGIAVISIVFCGLAMAFGELGGVFKTVLGVLIGCCLAVLGSEWLGSLGIGTGCECHLSGVFLLFINRCCCVKRMVVLRRVLRYSTPHLCSPAALQCNPSLCSGLVSLLITFCVMQQRQNQ